MLSRINWPSTVILVAFIAAWVILAVTEHDIPAWMAAVGAILGKLIVSFIPAPVEKVEVKS